jgi:hypothetical protein
MTQIIAVSGTSLHLFAPPDTIDLVGAGGTTPPGLFGGAGGGLFARDPSARIYTNPDVSIAVGAACRNGANGGSSSFQGQSLVAAGGKKGTSAGGLGGRLAVSVGPVRMEGGDGGDLGGNPDGAGGGAAGSPDGIGADGDGIGNGAKAAGDGQQWDASHGAGDGADAGSDAALYGGGGSGNGSLGGGGLFVANYTPPPRG